MDKPKLKLIPGGDNPNDGPKITDGQLVQLKCPLCKGTEFLIASFDPLVDLEGQIVSGTSRMICIPCLARGEVSYAE